MNGALLASVLGTSFLGSLHCVGMCGPLVGAYVEGEEAEGGAWLPHVAYHLGRLLTLLLAGAAFGAIGKGLDGLGGLAGFQRGVAWVAGGAMVVWGLVALIRGWHVDANLPGVSRLPIGRALSALARRPGRLGRAAGVGLLTPLLPCGWLALYAVTAAGTGEPAAGAAVMAAFWAGTVPALAGLGVALRTVLRSLRPRLPALGGAMLIALGVVTLVQRARLREGADPAAPASCGCHESGPAAAR